MKTEREEKNNEGGMKRMDEQKKTLPVFSCRIGCIDAAVWAQEGPTGPFYTVSARRNYKTGEEWKTSHSLSANDIPCMITALTKCWEWIKTKKIVGTLPSGDTE